MRGVGCQIFLAAGANIEVRDDRGISLHNACVIGNERMIRILLLTSG